MPSSRMPSSQMLICQAARSAASRSPSPSNTYTIRQCPTTTGPVPRYNNVPSISVYVPNVTTNKPGDREEPSSQDCQDARTRAGVPVCKFLSSQMPSNLVPSSQVPDSNVPSYPAVRTVARMRSRTSITHTIRHKLDLSNMG